MAFPLAGKVPEGRMRVLATVELNFEGTINSGFLPSSVSAGRTPRSHLPRKGEGRLLYCSFWVAFDKFGGVCGFFPHPSQRNGHRGATAIYLWSPLRGKADFVVCIRTAKKKRPIDSVSSFGIRQLPILPCRLQHSTFGVCGLNFCVRNENRWDPTA